MGIPSLSVILPDKRLVNLSVAIDVVVEALAEGGWVLVKSATNIYLDDGMQRNLVLNEAVKAILFTAQRGSYSINSVQQAPVPHGRAPGRDPNWIAIAIRRGIVAVVCYHLPGDRDNHYMIETDDRGRYSDPGTSVKVDATGGDMSFVPPSVDPQDSRLTNLQIYLQRLAVQESSTTDISLGQLSRTQTDYAKRIMAVGGDDLETDDDGHVLWKFTEPS
ncbi:MAG: hypothetical protein M1814_001250 [Vezdaea aestivalis]|nr:MAG: hypothetical protein M1814_001250 [Vezdaea aestivalis]